MRCPTSTPSMLPASICVANKAPARAKIEIRALTGAGLATDARVTGTRAGGVVRTGTGLRDKSSTCELVFERGGSHGGHIAFPSVR